MKKWRNNSNRNTFTGMIVGNRPKTYGISLLGACVHILRFIMEEESVFFILSPTMVAQFLVRVFEQWGFFVKTETSIRPGSISISLNTGTSEVPKTIFIRISDRTPEYWSKFEFDVLGSYKRAGSLNYLRLIERLARQLGKPLPPECSKLLEPDNYRDYVIRLQKNQRALAWRPKLDPLFYVA